MAAADYGVRAARHVVDWELGTTVEEQVGKHDKPDEDTVTVHVTPHGGFYVDERELLRSKAAQQMMNKMASILGEEHEGREGARRTLDSAEDPTGDR